MTEISDEALDVVNRLAAVNADIAQLTEQANDLKGRLRQLLREPGTYTAEGAKVVTLTPNRRFDPRLAFELLPDDLLRLCTVTKIDPAAAKKVLPPAIYEQFMVEAGDPVVRLT